MNTPELFAVYNEMVERGPMRSDDPGTAGIYSRVWRNASNNLREGLQLVDAGKWWRGKALIIDASDTLRHAAPDLYARVERTGVLDDD